MGIWPLQWSEVILRRWTEHNGQLEASRPRHAVSAVPENSCATFVILEIKLLLYPTLTLQKKIVWLFNVNIHPVYVCLTFCQSFETPIKIIMYKHLLKILKYLWRTIKWPLVKSISQQCARAWHYYFIFKLLVQESTDCSNLNQSSANQLLSFKHLHPWYFYHK